MLHLMQSMPNEGSLLQYWQWDLLNALILVLTACTTLALSFALASKGPRVIRIAMFALTTAMVFFTAFSHLVLLKHWTILQSTLMLMIPLLYIISGILPANFAIKRIRHKVRDKTLMANRARLVALERFDWLDKDGDGELSEKDIVISITAHPNPLIDHVVLQYLLDHFSQIGHVAKQEERIVPMPIPGMPIGVVPTKMDVKIFAISKEDIDRWPAKVIQLYKRWPEANS